jgi:tetratricopeptide (TPR) repeat protein
MSGRKALTAQAVQAIQQARTELARFQEQVATQASQITTQAAQIKKYQEAFDEVEAQRNHMFKLFCELRMSRPDLQVEDPLKSTWPGHPHDTKVRYHSKDGLDFLPMKWISTPDTRKQIGEAEAAWKANQPQRAIIALDKVFKEGIQGETRINALLLRSVIFRAAQSFELALECASTALALAAAGEFYLLREKSQYFRAWCFFEMGDLEEAKWVLNFAVDLSPYEDHVEILQKLVDESLERKHARQLRDRTESTASAPAVASSGQSVGLQPPLPPAGYAINPNPPTADDWFVGETLEQLPMRLQSSHRGYIDPGFGALDSMVEHDPSQGS